jgi:hypothetical protein
MKHSSNRASGYRINCTYAIGDEDGIISNNRRRWSPMLTRGERTILRVELKRQLEDQHCSTMRLGVGTFGNMSRMIIAKHIAPMIGDCMIDRVYAHVTFHLDASTSFGGGYKPSEDEIILLNLSFLEFPKRGRGSATAAHANMKRKRAAEVEVDGALKKSPSMSYLNEWLSSKQ